MSASKRPAPESTHLTAKRNGILNRKLGLVFAAAVAMASALAGTEPLALGEVRSVAAAGRPADALAMLDELLAERPADVGGRLLRGVLLVETGRAREAEAVFQELITERPELPEPYNNLAVIQAADGRYEEAVDTLLASLQTHSSYGTAYDNLTKVYSRLAGEAYSEALSEGRQRDAGPVELVMLADLALQEPVVAAAPVAAPAPTAPTDVATTVREWAAAWAAQEPDAYLAFYSSRFAPPGGLSRARWERQRRERLTGPEYIKVSLAFLDSRQLDDGRASVRFIQSYESDRFRDTVTKTLELVREDGVWKISAERVES